MRTMAGIPAVTQVRVKRGHKEGHGHSRLRAEKDLKRWGRAFHAKSSIRATWGRCLWETEYREAARCGIGGLDGSSGQESHPPGL